MRTNVDIDDKLMKEAKKATKTKTKKETIEKGLKLLISVYGQRAILGFKGKLKWSGDLNQMRATRA